jgi:hypothetical protein
MYQDADEFIRTERPTRIITDSQSESLPRI